MEPAWLLGQRAEQTLGLGDEEMGVGAAAGLGAEFAACNQLTVLSDAAVPAGRVCWQPASPRSS